MISENDLFQAENLLIAKSEKIYSNMESLINEYEKILEANKVFAAYSQTMQDDLLSVSLELQGLKKELNENNFPINLTENSNGNVASLVHDELIHPLHNAINILKSITPESCPEHPEVVEKIECLLNIMIGVSSKFEKISSEHQ